MKPLRECFDAASTAVEKQFGDGSSTIIMMLLFGNVRDETTLVGIVPPDPADKEKTFEAISEMMKLAGAVWYTLTFEGWVAEYKSEEEWRKLPVRMRKDKRECIFVLAVNNEEVLSGLREIIRDEGGARLGPLQEMEKGEQSGMLAELLS